MANRQSQAQAQAQAELDQEAELQNQQNELCCLELKAHEKQKELLKLKTETLKIRLDTIRMELEILESKCELFKLRAASGRAELAESNLNGNENATLVQEEGGKNDSATTKSEPQA